MELSVIDRTDPRTALSLLTEDMARQIEEAAASRPDLFGIGESALWKALGADGARPDASDSRIRMQFWLEYDSAMDEGRKIDVKKIYAGVVHKSFFYGTWIKSAQKIAWMMTRPIDYVVKVQEARDFGIDRMRDYLALDPSEFSPKKEVQLRLMEYQAKLTIMLDNRDKGAVTQNINQKTLQITGVATEKQVGAALMDAGMEGIQKRLSDLDKLKRKAQNLVEIKPDVEIEK